MIEAIDLFDHIDRREIQDMTWEKHQYDNWKRVFSNAIDQSIEKHKQPSLEIFYED